MSLGLEGRFAKYCGTMVAALHHADREEPARQYLQGLLLPGGRKSIEPMAARVAPERVRAVHQSMHHLVAQADWSDTALLTAVAGTVLPKLTRDGAPVHWIIDDTGMPKKGKHSVGVAHQYCGQTGKQDNCQVAVSLSLATRIGSLPIGYRLYLPREWAEDAARRQQVGVPVEVAFATKPELALQQIRAALQAGYPQGTVLADAAYGDETAWREAIASLGLNYAVGVRSATSVWWGTHQPATAPQAHSGSRRRRLKRDAAHQPIAVAELARSLPRRCWRTVTWREGTAQPLSSRFARVRVRAAHDNQPRAEEWLIIEWPSEAKAPAHYWLSNLPVATQWQAMVDTLMSRWRIERDYEELKQELGLGHFEGRNWRGFHHHASLCIAAYGFLILERLAGVKKNAAGFTAPALPEGFRPRGAGADAAAHPQLDRDLSLSTGTRHRPNAGAMSVLRTPVSSRTNVMTQ